MSYFHLCRPWPGVLLLPFFFKGWAHWGVKDITGESKIGLGTATEVWAQGTSFVYPSSRMPESALQQVSLTWPFSVQKSLLLFHSLPIIKSKLLIESSVHGIPSSGAYILSFQQVSMVLFMFSILLECLPAFLIVVNSSFNIFHFHHCFEAFFDLPVHRQLAHSTVIFLLYFICLC